MLHSRLLALAALLAALVVLPACDSGGGTTEPPPNDTILFGLNYTRLFAPPTAAEVMGVREDWADRNPQTAGTKTVASAEIGDATYRVLQHTVSTSNGESVTHVGIVRIPLGATNLPVVVVHHGGDDGFSINASTSNTGVEQWVAAFPELASQTVQAWPVYRSETIEAGTDIPAGPFTASGDPSPWDYDVDDSIAFLTATLERWADETDSGNVVAMGMSRGANTALLHAIRDDRIGAVVDYYGPADFYNAGAQTLATGVLTGNAGALSLPGAQYLLDNVLDPLRTEDGGYNASADYATGRLEVLRRSASAFTTDLPDTQVHHHYRDGVVPITFSQALAESVAANGSGGSFEFFPYGTPPASPADASPIFHAPEVSPEMQPSLSTVQSFLLNAVGLGNASRRPALALTY